MTEKTYWESFKAEGEQIVDTIRQLIHEGNVRRVVVQQHGRTIAEFPLTVGVVGAVLAPVVAAIGAIVARQRTAPSRSREAKRRTSRMRSRVRRWVDAGVSPSKGEHRGEVFEVVERPLAQQQTLCFQCPRHERVV